MFSLNRANTLNSEQIVNVENYVMEQESVEDLNIWFIIVCEPR